MKKDKFKPYDPSYLWRSESSSCHSYTGPVLDGPDMEAAKSRAYCPKSNHPVGAIGQGQSGRLYYGCNVEFPIFTQHAEQTLISFSQILSDPLIAVYLSESPCGNCRQALREAFGPDLAVYFKKYSNTRGQTINDLIPYVYERKVPQTDWIKMIAGDPTIDAMLQASSVAKPIRTGIPESCAVKFKNFTFHAPKHEYCSFPGNAFYSAMGIAIASGVKINEIPEEICYAIRTENNFMNSDFRSVQTFEMRKIYTEIWGVEAMMIKLHEDLGKNSGLFV